MLARLFFRQPPAHSSRGFTLIELLVVIAIIGLLASVVVASLGTARAKGRDARRLTDMRQLVNALELYASDNQHYPTSTWLDINACDGGYADLSTVLTSTYISTVPKDPQFCQWYGTPDGGTTYFLYYEFEIPQPKLSRDCGNGDWGGNWYCTKG